MDNIEDAAAEYLDLGFSIIPIVKGTKEPPYNFKWAEYQQRQPTTEEVEQWFKQWPDSQIALVTGMVSGVGVIDADGPEGIKWIKNNLPATPVYQKTGKGWHAFYHLTRLVGNKVKFLPELDVRGQGGYVIIAPSIHPSGKQYELIFPIDGQGWEDLTEFPYDAIQPQTKDPITLQPVDEGERNDTLAKIVGKYITKNLSFEEISNLCTGWNLSCINPLGQKELETTVTSIFKTHYRNHPLDYFIPEDELSSKSSKSSDSSKSCILKQNQAKSSIDQSFGINKEDLKKSSRDLNQEIRLWILEQTGIIKNFDIDQEFCLRSRQEKNARSSQLNYLKKHGKVAPVKDKVGTWRILANDLIRQNPLSIKAKPYKIPMPLGTYELVDIYPKNIIIIAGAPNSGKTSFALNFAFFCALLDSQAAKTLYKYVLSNNKEGQAEGLLDMPEFFIPNGPIRYFNSEMDETELSKRISVFPESDEWTKNVEFYERSSNFQDVIDPNGINIIDYLSILDNFWEVGKPIQEIHEILKKGIAVICLQKKPGAEFAKGGAVTLEVPRLVINMDNNSPFGGVAKIAKAKAWATKNNPNGLERDYKIVDSWKIVPASDWRYVTEKERLKVNADYKAEKAQKKEYVYEFRLEDGSLAGLNYGDRQEWIKTYPNVNIDFELTNLKKKLEFRSWLKRKNWFFQVSAYLKQEQLKTSQTTIGESG